jgi:pimeloyl-ACP methyl ester carboxylesterase
VGNSLGGLIALEMAVQRPARALVLVAAPAPLREEVDRNLARLITWFRPDGVPEIPDVAELRRVTVQADERILALANGNMNRARGFLNTLPAVMTYPWRERAQAVHCPVALFWGEQDGLVTRAHLERWQEVFPEASTVIFPRAAHGPQFDAADEFNTALNEFLERLKAEN